MRLAPLLACLALAGAPGAAAAAARPTRAVTGLDEVLRLARPALRVYTDRDGLPENSIFDVEIDRRGYTWVATENGAASYNGRRWTPLRLPEGRSTGFVRDMLAGADGSLWLAMDRRGLYRLRDGRWTVFQHETGFPSDAIARVLEAQEADGRASDLQ